MVYGKMKQRATYSKDYKKGQELKKIHETCKAEDRRCLIILKEITKQWKYNASPEEYSHILEFEKKFEEQIKS